jgi:hypothetical protein
MNKKLIKNYTSIQNLYKSNLNKIEVNTNLKFSKIEKLNSLLELNKLENKNNENSSNNSLNINVNSLKNYNNNLMISKNSIALAEYKENRDNLSGKDISSSNRQIINFEELNLNRVSRYIKSISNFKSDIALNQEIIYNFIKKGNNKKYSINNIYSILESCFNPMYSLISKPIFKINSNKVNISLFFYLVPGKKSKLNGKDFLEVNHKRLEFVCEILNKMFNKTIDLELTRLYHPFTDSNILANTIGPISDLNPFIKIRRRILKRAKVINPSDVKNRFINKGSIFGLLSSSPSFLSGIKISIKGRLLIQKVIPRKTTYNFQKGSLSRAKANFVQTSRFTNKNKRGAYSITVNIGHGIN